MVEDPFLRRSHSFAATASSILSYLICLGGMITVGVAVYMVVISYTALPYSDAWTEVTAAARGVNLLSPQWLWAQHNEHRIVLPKLFLAIDLLLFRGRQIFPLASILIIQLALLVLLGWSLRVLGGWRRAVWRTGLGLIGFGLFCPSQWENFVWPFQTCFVLPGLCATLSFAGLLVYWRTPTEWEARHRWMLLLLSIAAALGATCSLANGNLVWPLLVVAAICVRLPVKVVLIYVSSAMLSTLAFFHHYALPSQPARLLSSFDSMRRVGVFALAYLGSAWVNTAQAAETVGGLAISAALLAAILLFRKKTLAEPLPLLAILVMLFVSATAVITGLARLHLGIEQAFTSRYQTPVLLFWCGFGVLLLLALKEIKSFAVLLVLAQICLLAVFVRGAVLARYPLRQAMWHGFQVNAAAAALMTDVKDPERFGYANVDEHIGEDRDYLEQRRLSVFAGVPYSKLGKALAAEFQVRSPESCVGELQAVTRLQGTGGEDDVSVSGWAWDLARREPPSYIVTVADGRVAGLGAVGDWRPTVRAAHRYLRTSFVGFTAYVKNEKGDPPAEVYAVSRSNPPEVCRIATGSYSDVK